MKNGEDESYQNPSNFRKPKSGYILPELSIPEAKSSMQFPETNTLKMDSLLITKHGHGVLCTQAAVSPCPVFSQQTERSVLAQTDVH